MSEHVIDNIAAGGIVPVVVLTDPAAADPLAAALLHGGLRCAEVTFRTDAAVDAIKAMAAHPEMLVGAGTVLTPAQVDLAVEAGARFVVSPGFSAAVVAHCLFLGLTSDLVVAGPNGIEHRQAPAR